MAILDAMAVFFGLVNTGLLTAIYYKLGNHAGRIANLEREIFNNRRAA